MKVLFWLCGVWLAYVYVGYPILLGMLATLRARPVPGSVPNLSQQPSVTLIVSAYNEARVIGEKIRNSLALDYPQNRINVVVVSDASTDGTDDIVRQFSSDRVELLRMARRGGKTAGLNAAVASAQGEIIVFSDANAMYRADAIRELVAPFADPAIGCVTGAQLYHDAEAGSAGEGEGLYWRYEQWIKRQESRLGSVIGGDGAIYAIRRFLYRPMLPEDVSDFVNPLQIVLDGHRNVFAPAAVAMEHFGDSDDKEFRRKVRIVNQSWRAVTTMPQVLNPVRVGVFSWQVWSHKVLRWLALVPMALLLLSNLSLVGQGAFYTMALCAQLGCYVLALFGWVLRGRAERPSLVTVPYYFALVNVASLKGVLEHYQGKTYATWATIREN